MKYFKSIQITLTEGEYRDVEKATALSVSKTGTPVSVTKYVKNVLMEEVKKRTEEIQ